MSWTTDIQANILRGLPATRCRYLFITGQTPDALRGLLRDALVHVHSAGWQTDHVARGRAGPLAQAVVNLAFTRHGLRFLGAPYTSDERVRGAVTGKQQEADAFAFRRRIPISATPGAITLQRTGRNSMYRRLDLLGEAPTCQPDGTTPHSWTWPAAEALHALVWISGPDGASVAAVEQHLVPRPDIVVNRSLSARRDALDPFGFKDGVVQPAVEGFHTPSEIVGRGAWTAEGWRGLKPGEFIIGQEDEGGERRRPEPGDVLANGTYLVFRQIKTWRTRLTALENRYSQQLGVPPDEVAGWLVGRNRPRPNNDGTSLMVDGPAEDRGFIYGHDPEGLVCPLGAHVRRSNPRDSMGKDGRRAQHHHIIRRGMTYFKNEAHAENPGSSPKGLAFISLQGRIEDGFEFIQGRWLNTGATLHAGVDPDPIAGNAAPDVAAPQFVKSGQPSAVIELKEPLTEVLGGEYFVMPSMDGLRILAQLAARP